MYTALWCESLELPTNVLDAAFRKAIRSCRFWPVKIADILEHVDHAKETAAFEAAGRAWERVLELRRRFWNPDMPGGFSRGMPKLSPRIERACRAAGVFRGHESVEALHVWTKKKFIESFLRCDETGETQNLLSDGETKNLLTSAAQTKALPAPDSYEDAHARGLAYAEQLKTSPAEDPNIKRALLEIRQRACVPSTRSLEEQKRILCERGFLQMPDPKLREGLKRQRRYY